MLFSAFLTGFDLLTKGISVYQTASSLHGLVTGNTPTKRLDTAVGYLANIDANLERLNAHLALSRVSEFDRLKAFGPLPQDVLSGMGQVQKALGTDLIQSQAAAAPDRFMEVFRENPERLLHGITRLKGAEVDRKLFDDPTMMPVMFFRNGEPCLGWAKEAAITVPLGSDFRPRLAPKPIPASPLGLGLGNPLALPGVLGTGPLPSAKPAPGLLPHLSLFPSSRTPLAGWSPGASGRSAWEQSLWPAAPERLTAAKMLTVYGGSLDHSVQAVINAARDFDRPNSADTADAYIALRALMPVSSPSTSPTLSTYQKKFLRPYLPRGFIGALLWEAALFSFSTPLATAKCANIERRGDWGDADPIKARQMLEKAPTDPFAKRELAHMLYWGQGCAQDKSRAERLVKEALDQEAEIIEKNSGKGA